MDANGTRFWLLADARHFPAVSHAGWSTGCRRLRLASERTLVPALPAAEAFTAAQAALESVPRAVDALECVARWDAASNTVLAKSYLPDDTPLLPLEAPPTDLCAAADGVLYAALPTSIRLHDLRGRWADVTVSIAGFAPWRLAPAAEGGVWAMERNSGRLARLTGHPLRTQTPAADAYDGRVFRPEPENGCAPALTLLDPPLWATGERPLALAAGPDGALAFLSWLDGEGTAAVRRWEDAHQRLSAPLRLQGAAYAYSLTWLAPDRIAVRLPGRRDAPAFDLSTADISGTVMPLSEVYPLPADAPEAPFCNGAVLPPMVPSGERSAQPLLPLSFNALARRGEAATFEDASSGFTAWLIDSGDNTTVWHRLVAEAVIPAQTGFVAWLAATNDPRPPATNDLTAWHPHGFGRDIATLDDALLAPQAPRAAWDRAPSELPGHPGLLGGQQQAGVSGLFSVWVQAPRARVRQIVGRYLWVRLVLHGNGRAGPEIAALRAWGGRFSYPDHYLPRLYRESLFGEAASAPGVRLNQIDATFAPALDAGAKPSDALAARLRLAQVPTGDAATVVVEKPGQAWLLRDGSRAWRLAAEPNVDGGVIGIYQPQASGADFNARLLGNFEGVLTQLEDRVAAAHLCSDPSAAPEPSLDWLAAWVGLAFDPVLPAARRRDWLRAAPELARRHGTRDGLRLALDVATGGGVRAGSIVVVEDFRLRRLMATLLGVDLVDEDDPLLPGLQRSGNSVVGDTLFVGDQERIELMALFRADQATNEENDAVTAFYDQLAFRTTVLVHEQVQPQDFALIRRIARLESPAHVEVNVTTASWPLLVGIASLVGVDTYLAPPRLPRPVQVERSALGMGDFLIGVPVLDPRLSGSPAGTPPLADAGDDRAVDGTSSFVLDGSASRAAPGRRITEYRWRWLPP